MPRSRNPGRSNKNIFKWHSRFHFAGAREENDRKNISDGINPAYINHGQTSPARWKRHANNTEFTTLLAQRCNFQSFYQQQAGVTAHCRHDPTITTQPATTNRETHSDNPATLHRAECRCAGPNTVIRRSNESEKEETWMIGWKYEWGGRTEDTAARVVEQNEGEGKGGGKR